jgi:hypothetical protein
LQDAAQYSVTDGVANGTTTITSATANFGTDVVGNIMYVQGGTGSITAGWYQVATRSSATTITVDRSTGLTAGTGVTLKIGGGFASVGNCFAQTVFSLIYVKAGTYAISTASTNVSGGCISTSTACSVIGYSANRTPTNRDTSPVLQLGAGVSSATICASSGPAYFNITFDGNGQTAARHANGGRFVRCLITNFNTASANNASTYYYCKATTNSAAVFIQSAYLCEAYANTATPFGTMLLCSFCISNGNTGASTDGFGATAIASSGQYIDCVAYGNGRDGFRTNGLQYGSMFTNCIAEGNAGFGFNNTSSANQIGQGLVNCATFNNTSGSATGFTGGALGTVTEGTITVTAGSVFVDASTSNFALNNIASRGALLRAAGYPSTLPAGLTQSFFDVGVSQHKDPPWAYVAGGYLEGI